MTNTSSFHIGILTIFNGRLNYPMKWNLQILISLSISCVIHSVPSCKERWEILTRPVPYIFWIFLRTLSLIFVTLYRLCSLKFPSFLQSFLMTFQNFPKARQLLETTHWGRGQGPEGQQTTDRRQKDRQIFLGKYSF